MAWQLHTPVLQRHSSSETLYSSLMCREGCITKLQHLSVNERRSCGRSCTTSMHKRNQFVKCHASPFYFGFRQAVSYYRPSASSNFKSSAER